MRIPPRVGSAKYVLTKESSTVLYLVRVLAAQAVLIGHLLKYLGIYPADGKYPYIQSLSVTVFFLLSGFLTMYSYLSKRESQPDYGWWDFFANRVIRIYGALIPALLIVLGLDLINFRLHPAKFPFRENFNLVTLIENFFMCQNFPVFRSIPLFSHQAFGSARPLWSLPLEWWLYMLFGLLVYAYPKYKKRPFFWIALLFSSIIPLYNAVWGSNNGLTFTWLIGILVCVGLFSQWTRESRLPALHQFVLCVLTLALAWKRVCKVHGLFRAVNLTIDYDPLFSAWLGIALFLVLWIVQLTPSGGGYIATLGFLENPVKLLSAYSFALYLTHYSLIDLLCRTIPSRNHVYLMALAFWAICNLFAVLVYSLEKLTVRLLKKGFFRLKALKSWLDAKMYF